MTELDLGQQEIERLHSGLRLLALRSLSDPERAEEVAQEALTRTIVAVRNGRPENIGAFAYGIVRNLIGDEYRARDMERRMRQGALPVWQRNPAGALDEIVTQEGRRRVREALSRLSARDRKVLRLSFYDGLTAAEIADRLGEPSPRIRKRKSRALDRIRRVFLEMESLESR